MFISLASDHGMSGLMPFEVSKYPELMDSVEATVHYLRIIGHPVRHHPLHKLYNVTCHASRRCMSIYLACQIN